MHEDLLLFLHRLQAGPVVGHLKVGAPDGGAGSDRGAQVADGTAPQGDRPTLGLKIEGRRLRHGAHLHPGELIGVEVARGRAGLGVSTAEKKQEADHRIQHRCGRAR